MLDTQVLIVGAGPTGLMLAIELALAGVRPLVIERLERPDETIKAGAIGALAAEALQRRGLGLAIEREEAVMGQAVAEMAKRLGGAATPPDWRRIGGHFSGLFLIDQSRQREPERRLRGVRQLPLEHMLNARAAELGIEIRRGVAFQGFEETAGEVTVVVRDRDGEHRLVAQYLVGCDGGRSPVRKYAGFDFPGTAPTIVGHQAVVELDHPERLALGWQRTPVGTYACGPVPGRVFVVEFDGPPTDREQPITAGEVEASLRKVSGADVRVLSMQSGTRFTDHARQAASYRKGRVLLAGDAAHVHSPFGGQGLNLGLIDAANLGFKLAAVARGAAAADLLDTYTAERHPVAARVLANTRAQVALMRPGELTSALRDIVTEIMGLEEGNRYFGELISGVRTRYDLDGTDPRIGTLAGDFPIGVHGRRLFDLMQDGQAVLVDASGGGASRLAAAWGDRVSIAPSTDGQSLFIRPDGCIAWAGEGAEIAGLDAALGCWLGESLMVPA